MMESYQLDSRWAHAVPTKVGGRRGEVPQWLRHYCPKSSARVEEEIKNYHTYLILFIRLSVDFFGGLFFFFFFFGSMSNNREVGLVGGP